MLAEHEDDGGGPAAAILLSRALPVAEQIVGALRAHPAADRVEVAGSLRRLADSVKDLDVIATASDPAALVARAAPSSTLVESVRIQRRRRRARDDALGAEGRPQGRRARPVRQRAPALHRLQGAQRGAARVGRAARAARLRVRDPRRRDRRDDSAARPRRRSTRARARLDPARAARGPRRARGCAAGGTACRSWSSSSDIRGDLHCHTTLSDGRQTARGDGRGARGRAATSTSRSPTTPPRTGSATTSPPDDARAPHRGGARAQRALRRLRAARRHRVEHPPRRLARLPRRAARPSSTGSSPRSTPRSAWTSAR